MKEILVIGIGVGNPEHLTVQAIKALNRVDVFFILEKGGEADALARIREEICARYIEDDSYRIVRAPSPERDRRPADYRASVEDWDREKAALYRDLIARELNDGDCGGILVWGDPSLYDGTLRVLSRILEDDPDAFSFEVIPGITSIQALAAAHRLSLTEIGGSFAVTTGRQLPGALATGADNVVVVMLDSGAALQGLNEPGLDIYWGAYLGTADEVRAAGAIEEVRDEIRQLRESEREAKGWIMDTYLLRRRK